MFSFAAVPFRRFDRNRIQLDLPIVVTNALTIIMSSYMHRDQTRKFDSLSAEFLELVCNEMKSRLWVTLTIPIMIILNAYT